jgi:PKD repeat protein
VEPPTASFNYSPTEPKAGETVTFDASGSAPNGGTIIEYAWDFDDGNTTATSEEVITHVYDIPGTYDVTLTVTDSEGLTDSTWQEITVIPAITIVHDVAVTDVAVSSNIVYQGWIVGINVTVANLGNATETFTVTLYYDSTVIATRLVQNLAPNETLTLNFDWNTTGVPYCHNYTIKAVASTVPGETNIDNNTFIDGQVKIKIMGDVNGDGSVNYLDAIACGAAFSSTSEDPNWNPQADLKQDGYINYLDVILCGANFGASCL